MKKHFPLLLLLVLFSCQPKVAEQTANAFNEKFRPQYHFTPPSQWMNDPNGMVYYDGEYHLFYQHYPDSNVWGPMHWGHAVSKDMVSWEHLPIALYPDSLGYIFSGSAVIDWNNTSGFGTKDNPPMVAIYTYHNPEWLEEGRLDFQYQGIAHSLDKGRSWIKYQNNPVLKNQGFIDFRDPKVSWYEPEQKWIMTLAVWDHVSFYSSKNLKDWQHESDFGVNWGSHAGVWECPDLFQVAIEDTNEKRWVLLVSINPGGPAGGSATQYFIGDFDGNTFTLDQSFAERFKTIPGKFPKGKVYDDFENGYDHWTVSGDAFGKAPAKGAIGNQNKVTGFSGQFLVNSYGGSDKLTGKMESQPFNITQPFINFRMGGGSYENETYMALVIDDKEVKKSWARNGEKLTIKSWDVSNFIDKNAFIRIVDNSKSIWGHINVDDITFADEPAKSKVGLAAWVDYGADNYAGVTWSNVPEQDGRQLFLGWMSNWQYAKVVPTYKWRSAMTVPRSLSLVEINDQLILKSKPVTELKNYLSSVSVNNNGEVYQLPDSTLMIDIQDIEGSNLELTFSNSVNEKVVIKIDDQNISFDRTQAGISDFEAGFPGVHHAKNLVNQVTHIQIYLDKSSMELFINDGELVMTELVFPSEPYSQLETKGDIGKVQVFKVESIWE